MTDSAPVPSGFLRQHRKLILLVLFLLLVLTGIVAGLRWYLTCPCDYTPGMVLRGELVDTPVADWRFANEVPLCQVQVQGAVLSHAVNLNCMALSDGTLYLSCAQCEPKRWSRLARTRPEARLRLGGNLYPVRLERVTDPAEADQAWVARAMKVARLQGETSTDIPPRPEDAAWWTFRATSAVQ